MSRVAAIGGRAAGVCLHQRVADRRDRQLRVARVLPPVWVEVAGVIPARVYALAQDQHPGFTTGVVEHVLEPVVDVAARAYGQRGAGDGLDVAGPRLVLVRIGVRLKDLVDVDPPPPDVAHEVSDLGRRGDHGLAGGRSGASFVPAAAADKRGAHEDESDDERQGSVSGRHAFHDSAQF